MRWLYWMVFVGCGAALVVGLIYLTPHVNQFGRTQVVGLAAGEQTVTGSLKTETLAVGGHTVELVAQTVRGDDVTDYFSFAVAQPTPTAGGGGSGGGGGGGGGGGRSGGGGDDPVLPKPAPKPKSVFTWQAEKGHTIQGSRFSGIFVAGKRTIVRLADNQALLEKAIKVPRGNYWLEITASHDRPASVRVAILINGRRWKTIALDKNDDKYRTMRVGKLSRFGGGKVTFRLLNDIFDRKNQGNAAADRNFEIDSWRLVSD